MSLASLDLSMACTAPGVADGREAADERIDRLSGRSVAPAVDALAAASAGSLNGTSPELVLPSISLTPCLTLLIVGHCGLTPGADS